MPFPPATQKTDATNALASDTEHPLRHNNVGEAINDIVAEMVSRSTTGLRRVAGAWAVPIPCGSLSNTAGVAGQLRLVAFLVGPEDIPINEIGFRCNTAVASTTVAGAIYDSTSAMYPGALIASTAAMDTGVAGDKFEAKTGLTLVKHRWYWSGGLYVAGAGNVLSVIGSAHAGVLRTRPVSDQCGTIMATGLTALPATFPAGVTASATSGVVPRIYMGMS